MLLFPCYQNYQSSTAKVSSLVWYSVLLLLLCNQDRLWGNKSQQSTPATRTLRRDQFHWIHRQYSGVQVRGRVDWLVSSWMYWPYRLCETCWKDFGSKIRHFKNVRNLKFVRFFVTNTRKATHNCRLRKRSKILPVCFYFPSIKMEQRITTWCQ